ncbi:hypothetical protein Tco_0161301 [Tanacetum coccineum]
MSTLVFVDPESSTQANEAQTSRVPVPLTKDPYEAISTPHVGHVEESEGSDTSGAGSTSSDSTTPLSPDHSLPMIHPFWFYLFIGPRVWFCVSNLRCHMAALPV